MKPFAMQILLKNGTYIHIGVLDKKEYRALKRKITLGFSNFVTLIEECTVQRKEIAVIEFVEMQRKEGK